MGVALVLGLLWLAFCTSCIGIGVVVIMRRRGWRRRLLISGPVIMLATLPMWIWDFL